MSVSKLPDCLGRASCERRRFFRDRVRNVWSRSREAGFAGLSALVDTSEGAHGGNRVSPVKRAPAGREAAQPDGRSPANRSTSTSTSSLFIRTPSAPASLTASCSFGASSPVSATTATPSKGSFRWVRGQADGRPIALIGASLDLGAGRRGVDMGPSAIRYAGLALRIEGLGRPVFDWGNVEGAVPEATAVGNERVRFLTPIKQACERVAQLVARAVEE